MWHVTPCRRKLTISIRSLRSLTGPSAPGDPLVASSSGFPSPGAYGPVPGTDVRCSRGHALAPGSVLTCERPGTWLRTGAGTPWHQTPDAAPSRAGSHSGASTGPPGGGIRGACDEGEPGGPTERAQRADHHGPRGAPAVFPYKRTHELPPNSVLTCERPATKPRALPPGSRGTTSWPQTWSPLPKVINGKQPGSSLRSLYLQGTAAELYRLIGQRAVDDFFRG